MRPSDIDHEDLMHATLLQRPFTRPGWSFEMKLDGFRALARRDGDWVELISRNGNTLGPAFPEVVRALKAVPGNWVLDAELVVPNSKGRPSFDRVRRRAVMKLTKTIVDAVTKAPAALCVFDLLYARNSDVRVLPLTERRELLHELVKARPGLQVVSSIEGHGEAVFAKACELDFEGIVGKQNDAPYQRGKRPTWVKIKNQDYSRPEAIVGFRK